MKHVSDVYDGGNTIPLCCLVLFDLSCNGLFRFFFFVFFVFFIVAAFDGE